MYDGVRFYYYDDNILDAPTSPVTADSPWSTPGMWHLITLSVDAQGEGYLYVDNSQHVHFTTASSPATAALFSVCQVCAHANDATLRLAQSRSRTHRSHESEG